MLTTFLFDLDGTLLPLDMNAFLSRYFKELTVKFKDYFSGEILTAHVLGATKYMIENKDPNKTNQEAFFKDFLERVGLDRRILEPIFDEFYEVDFDRVKVSSCQNQWMIKAVKTLKKKGYRLVVATNPIFPRRAIEKRIQWAGLQPEDFFFITSFEKMHYCKPHLDYYQEILTLIQVPSHECMMVGNDVEEDMIAKKLNMRTFLIEDHMIQRYENSSMIDNRGKYEDFYHFVTKLPQLK